MICKWGSKSESGVFKIMKKYIIFILVILQVLLLFGCSENPGSSKTEYGTGKEVEYEPCTEWNNGFESSFLGIGADLSEYTVYGTSNCDPIEYNDFVNNWKGRNNSNYLYQSVYMLGADYDGEFMILIELGTLEDFKNELNLPELTSKNTYEQLKNAFIREHARSHGKEMEKSLSENEKTKIGDKWFESYEIDAEYGEFNSNHSECTYLDYYGISRQILSTKGQYVIRITVNYNMGFKSEHAELSTESKIEYARGKYEELISKFYLVN